MISNGDQGFTLHGGDALRFPLLISVPHAGRDYPREVYDNLRLPAASLVRLEDRYADLLVRDAIALGSPTMIAHRARAWIDLNRHERDIDTEMVVGMDRSLAATPGIKQRGGLGLIPRRLAGEGEIWRGPITAEAVEDRLASFHRPYHDMISIILEQMRARFGVAILLDIHSMPPLPNSGAISPPRFVVGDRFGRSASSQITESIIAHLRAEEYPCALNHPYSGDHMLTQHGRPKSNIHAVQIEIDRSLYLDVSLREPTEGVARISRLIGDIAQHLCDDVGGATLLAAE